MWPDQVSNLGPQAYELDVLLTALHRPTFAQVLNTIIV